MHKIYSTEGIVLAKRGHGEANVRIVLLTEGLGLISASARSSRVEHSKLRYGLEPLTRARFALVRGKAEWRLTGVEQISHDCIGVSSARRQASGRIARLLLRLVQGEEPLVELYRAVREGLLFLAAAVGEQPARTAGGVQSGGDAQAVECVLVLRVLAHLGYLPHMQELAPFIADTFFSVELAAEAAKSRVLLIRTINESLQQSGL
jgi:recombinational DNA repair protein (RecF pathway)